jgi:hypothetical protein
LYRLSCCLIIVSANWNDPYRKALQETDPKCVPMAVRLAETAVHARLDELAVQSDGGNRTERAALNTALRDLLALKAEYNLT